MACAGVIARRGDGSVATQAVGGVARARRAAAVHPGPAVPGRVDLQDGRRPRPSCRWRCEPGSTSTATPPTSWASGCAIRRIRTSRSRPAMLLSHTSGLRNGPSYPVPLGRQLSEAFTPGGRHYDAGGWFGPAEHRPGDWFAYADVNFALVAQMLERRAERALRPAYAPRAVRAARPRHRATTGAASRTASRARAARGPAPRRRPLGRPGGRPGPARPRRSPSPARPRRPASRPPTTGWATTASSSRRRAGCG